MIFRTLPEEPAPRGALPALRRAAYDARRLAIRPAHRATSCVTKRFSKGFHRHRFSPYACDSNTFSYSNHQWKMGLIGWTFKPYPPC